MKVTVLGHACLFIETPAASLLIDPWLIGSSYWRSWWHFPAIEEIEEKVWRPDFVALSHHHFDHFHYPSMRKLQLDKATIIIPKFGVDVMRNEMKQFPSSRVVELPHGEKLQLAPGFELGSYQCGLDDTTMLVRAGDVTLVNLNDSKPTDRLCQQIKRDAGEVRLMFKSHSWAQSYPNCYELEDPRDGGMVDSETFLRAFRHAAEILEPEHAIPFASMVGFLHPETRKCNAFAISPLMVRAAMEKDPLAGTKVEIMAPGDSWDSGGGFTHLRPDAFEKPQEKLAALAESVRGKVEQSLAEESVAKLPWMTFAVYMLELVSAIPFPVRWALFKRPVIFKIPSDFERPYWAVDFRAKTAERHGSLPANWGDVITIPEAVLVNAIEKKILFLVFISMRVSIKIRRGCLATDLYFWGFLNLFELGYLPLLSKCLKPRMFAVLWRRRMEVIDTLWVLLVKRSFMRAAVGTGVKNDAI